MDHKEREDIALFRLQVIGDLVVAGLSREERGSLFKDKTSRIYTIPHSRRTRVAESTLRDWVRLYERGGLDALKPPYRCDIGESRTLPQTVADQVLALREEDQSRSVHTILTMLRHAKVITPGQKIAPSTVYRLLHGRNLSKRTSAASKKDRRAFAFELPNQLWQSDVLHGPRMLDERTKKMRKTYLVTLLDDATRVVTHSAFCWSEKLIDFLPVMRQAILRRGVPDRLFVDNGAAYVSTHLSVICASLRIALIHARPYSPQSKGKIERWHRTMRGQLLSQIDFERVRTIDALNARLWAWIEGEYHRSPHRGLGIGTNDNATPLDRWMQHADTLRAAPRDIDEHFLVRAVRLVRHDRTVHLNSQIFEAPAEYINTKIELRYDPGRERLRDVYVYNKGSRAHTLRPLDVHANTGIKRQRDSEVEMAPKPRSGLNYAELVNETHAARLAHNNNNETTPNGGNNP